jgi:hypothetical protein
MLPIALKAVHPVQLRRVNVSMRQVNATDLRHCPIRPYTRLVTARPARMNSIVPAPEVAGRDHVLNPVTLRSNRVAAMAESTNAPIQKQGVPGLLSLTRAAAARRVQS